VPIDQSGEPSDATFDPTVSTAYPIEGKAGLMGDMPVRICAEGGELVAYGFGRQRIVLPARGIHHVRSRVVRDKDGGYAGSSLTVVGMTGQILLLARGPWGPGLQDVCDALPVPLRTSTGSSASSDPFRQGLAGSPPRAVLRIRPRGWLAAGLASFIGGLVTGGCLAAAGVALALLLPSSIGGIRDLIGIALGIGGFLGGVRLYLIARAVLLDSIRWLVTSARAGAPAPARRIFGGLGESGKWLAVLVTVVLGAALPLLFMWSLVIEADTISHGVSDQALVSQLRQHGTATIGLVVNVPYYTTNSNGDQVEHDQATLEFAASGGNGAQQVPDPAIGGWTWPMNPDAVVTIVYDPGDPQTAAVQGQITGSPWHGAPTGNIIAGGLVIITEPFLIWLFVRRVTAARRKATREFTEGLA
jgi:hypothetical protein